MKFAKDINDLVGNTPIVKLNRITRGLRPSVYAKLEMLNPGGSVKDRIASYLIAEAERKGILKKGGTIVEPTSGNTGVGLAQLAAVKGYKVVFTIPDKVGEDKRLLMRAYGAEVVVAPTNAALGSPEHYISVAKRIAKERKNAFMPNQYENLGNPKAHYSTTGPEIWKQTRGEVDALVATVGTGGTISGTGRYLKEKNGRIKVIGVEPEGSMYHNAKFGTDYPIHQYNVEGIGEDFMPKTYDQDVVDDIIEVNDEESFLAARRLVREEGILAGGSSGSAIAGCLKFAKKSRGVKNIVVILPDTGRNYLNRIFNDEWMRSKGFRTE